MEGGDRVSGLLEGRPQLARDCRQGSDGLVGRHAQLVQGHVVEALGELPNSGVAPPTDLRKDRPHLFDRTLGSKVRAGKVHGATSRKAA